MKFIVCLTALFTLNLFANLDGTTVTGPENVLNHILAPQPEFENQTCIQQVLRQHLSHDLRVSAGYYIDSITFKKNTLQTSSGNINVMTFRGNYKHVDGSENIAPISFNCALK